MKLKKLFGRKRQNKRQECIEMLKAMAAVMAFPEEAQRSLREDLDLTIATDEQVDIIHKGLIEMKGKYNQKYREQLFEKARASQN